MSRPLSRPVSQNPWCGTQKLPSGTQVACLSQVSAWHSRAFQLTAAVAGSRWDMKSPLESCCQPGFLPVRKNTSEEGTISLSNEHALRALFLLYLPELCLEAPCKTRVGLKVITISSWNF